MESAPPEHCLKTVPQAGRELWGWCLVNAESLVPSPSRQGGARPACRSDSQRVLALKSGGGVSLAGLHRLYEIHRLVSQETYPNCRLLAEWFEVSRRTAERDIERLRDQFGMAIEYDRQRKGYYYAEPADLPPVKLQEGEAIALFLGQRLLMQCKGTPFEGFVIRAMEKIRQLLPQSIEVSLERVLGSVSFHAEPLRGEEVEVANRYELLMHAIANRRTVLTDYYTAARQAVTPRQLDPYHLRFSEEEVLMLSNVCSPHSVTG